MSSPQSDPSRAWDQSKLSADTDQAVAELVSLVQSSATIVAMTGAGISTESGIPDYRGPNGVWATQSPPTLGDYQTNPATRERYWAERRDRYPRLAATKPNAGHRALVAMERAGRLTAIVTQNIDGLHQKAGSAADRVIELHGSAHWVRCLDCGKSWPAAEVQARQEAGEHPPICQVCGGPLRSATVLFGESLPAEALRRAALAAQSCDLMLVIGTSLVVNPAAQLPVIAKQAGAKLVIVNRKPTPLDDLADVVVRGDAGPALTVVAASIAS